MTQDDLNRYKWYHHFDFGDGVKTTPKSTAIEEFIWRNIVNERFSGLDVIDIGCRDGRFSFIAESLFANRIVAIDNDLSKGMTELLMPRFKSLIDAREVNLIHLTPEEVNAPFDIVMMFGVLYHLRYPIYGLKKAVDLLKKGGRLWIETAIFASEPQHLPMIFCPFKEQQPYEPGSVSYFNSLGLKMTLDSMGCTLLSQTDLVGSDTNPADYNVRRGFFVFEKTHDTPQYLREYWDGLHCCQSAEVENSVRNK